MPKIVDHDAYRKEMLEKCFKLFSRKGYQKVSMREICKEIGVSTGTLYHYFPAKENILEQMLPWAVEVNFANSPFKKSKGKRLAREEWLEEVTNFGAESGEHYKSLVMLVIDMLRNESKSSEKIFKRTIDAYRHGLVKNLGISSDSSKVVFTYVLGLVLHSLLTPDSFPYEEEIRSFLKTLANNSEDGNSNGFEVIKKLLDE